MNKCVSNINTPPLQWIPLQMKSPWRCILAWNNNPHFSSSWYLNTIIWGEILQVSSAHNTALPVFVVNANAVFFHFLIRTMQLYLLHIQRLQIEETVFVAGFRKTSFFGNSEGICQHLFFFCLIRYSICEIYL